MQRAPSIGRQRCLGVWEHENCVGGGAGYSVAAALTVAIVFVNATGPMMADVHYPLNLLINMVQVSERIMIMIPLPSSYILVTLGHTFIALIQSQCAVQVLINDYCKIIPMQGQGLIPMQGQGLILMHA